MKEEVYRVAERYGVPVFVVVSNSWMRVPRVAWINPVFVGEGPDAADDWIADRAGRGDVVITADARSRLRPGRPPDGTPIHRGQHRKHLGLQNDR